MQNDLAALVGSRICHDLISPIGAISNGVELLTLTSGDTSAEVGLISESVENASARIRFFRIAFGATSADQLVARGEVTSVLTAVQQGGRFQYDWDVDGEQPRSDVRLAFLLLQCCETAMPLGGTVTVERQGEDWTLTATGPRVTLDAALWDRIAMGRPEHVHTPAQVQFALIPEALKDTGRSLTVDTSPERITMRF